MEKDGTELLCDMAHNMPLVPCGDADLDASVEVQNSQYAFVRQRSPDLLRSLAEGMCLLRREPSPVHRIASGFVFDALREAGLIEHLQREHEGFQGSSLQLHRFQHSVRSDALQSMASPYLEVVVAEEPRNVLRLPSADQNYAAARATLNLLQKRSYTPVRKRREGSGWKGARVPS